jgi:thiamine-monophosphate kinase
MAASLTLQDLGEDNVVRRLTSGLPVFGGNVWIGPGDDCAALMIPGTSDLQLLKADSVVEGVHFQTEGDWSKAGRKAMCRAISDIAAMGGRPEQALVTLAIAPKTEWARLDAFYGGIVQAAQRYEVSIIGGETGRTDGPLVCSIFLTGRVGVAECLRRKGGRPGDVLFVTGSLGGSFASGRHLDFEPRLEQGQWLAQMRFPSAMMDLSDGLASDLQRLADASGCGADLDIVRLPCNPGCTPKQALCDGEDFELLLAVPPETVEALVCSWKVRFEALSLTQVGTLTDPLKGCTPREAFLDGGYDHFK